MTSIKELADKLGVTKTAVFQHMDSLGNQLTNHSKILKNKRVIDDKGVSLIINSFKNQSRKSNVQTGYRLLADERKAEIISKNKELESKNSQINQLNKLLNQSQELQLKQSRELTNIQNQSLPENKSNNKQSQATYTKHGFFWRLFH